MTGISDFPGLSSASLLSTLYELILGFHEEKYQLEIICILFPSTRVQPMYTYCASVTDFPCSILVKINSAPGELWNPPGKTVLSKCSFSRNKGPWIIWNDRIYQNNLYVAPVNMFPNVLLCHSHVYGKRHKDSAIYLIFVRVLMKGPFVTLAMTLFVLARH